MKRMISMALLAAMTLGIFTGCEEAPLTPTVTQQDADALIEKATPEAETVDATPSQAPERLESAAQPEAATPAGYESPARVEFDDELSGLKLTINAPVKVPQTEGYTVAEVKKAVYDEEYYRSIMQYFYQDDDWVTAPQDSGAVPFSFAEVQPGTFFEAYHYDRDTGKHSVLVGALEGNTYQYRQRSDAYWVREGDTENQRQKADLAACTPAISSEAALSIAVDAMQSFGADVQMKFSFSEKALYYDGDAIASAGWIFFFMRDCGGLQASYVNAWRVWKGSRPSHGAPWESEYICIIVDEDGRIAQYDSRGAGEQGQIVIKNADILPFGDILERIKKQLADNHAYQPDLVEEYSVTVYEIRLASALINVQDRQDVGHIVPTWEIMYDFSERLKGETAPTIFSCRLCLNAMDGSYIEPKAYIGRIVG